MEKYKISTYGMVQSISNCTGLPQSTVQDWVTRASGSNHALMQSLISDLVKAQQKVFVKWEKNARLQILVERSKARRNNKGTLN
jgi:hypothetical protein